MAALALLVPLLPLVLAAVAAAVGWRPVTAWGAPVIAGTVTILGGLLAARVLADGPVTALDGLLRVDALSAFMIIVIGGVALVATTYGVSYIAAELRHGHTDPRGARRYGALVQVFVAAMLGAVITDNLGLLWVAIEATTVATAFLVGHRHSRGSLEATWKYTILGSVGVALAFLGTVLVYFASRHAGVETDNALNWSTLVEVAPRLDPGVMRLGIGLLVLGYGTKVGLAPLHTWLPDAHSQAPAPVSALMSGVLLSVAFYALLRYKAIADVALDPGYMRRLLVTGALLSLLAAASLLIGQRDYKRLLAYSSIEHMGLIALGAAVGTPIAIAAVLLHVLGHGIGKAVLFCTSGEILLDNGSTQISAVHGLLARRGGVGTIFGVGLLALLGLPPFSLFASELAIVRAGIDEGLAWVVAAALLLVLVIFAAILRHALPILLGDPGDDPPVSHRSRGGVLVPLTLGLIVVAALGVSIWPIEQLLHSAAATVTG
jgi:hydrogenase-4 component F